MIEYLAAKVPHHRSAIAIGVLTGALALALPAEAGAAIVVPHAPKPEVTVPAPEPAPSAVPAPTAGGDPSGSGPSTTSTPDQTGNDGPGADQLGNLGYVDPNRQLALQQQQHQGNEEMAIEYANAMTGAPTPMFDAHPGDFYDDLAQVGLDIGDALTSSDPSGQSDVVTDVIVKAFTLISGLPGTTVCSKEAKPEGSLPICAK